MNPAIRQQAGQYYEFYKRQANHQALLARVAADLNLAPTELNFATLQAFGAAMYGVGADSATPAPTYPLRGGNPS